MEHLKQETLCGAQMNLDALYNICPQCFTESKDPKTGEIKHAVDFEKLRLLLGDNVAEGDERYDFTWVGKRAALQEAAKPIRKTLRPCPEESVDWENTKNLYIEGDNLEVLKLLQNSYMGKVKMIYIDPPYNTGNDFVYHDDFHQTKQDYDLFSGDVTQEGDRLVRNTESNGRFHSDWCSMIYSRLMVARTLMTEDGLIFISIDDHEQRNLKNICDEVFGENSFVAQFIWEKRLNRENRKEVSVRHDYILCYSKQEVIDGTRRVYQLPMNEKALANYGNPDNDPRGPWKSDPAHAQGGHGTPSQFYTLVAPNGKRHELPSGRCWLYTQKEMEKAIAENRIWFGQDGNGVPRVKTYLYAKERGLTPETILFAKEVSTNENAKNDLKELFDGKAVFDTPKPFELIEHLIRISSKEDIIVDFFSGASSTAHAVMQLNAEDGGTRKFIMVQWPEECDEESEAFKAGYKNICEIGKERIRRAGKKIMDEQKAKQVNLFAGDQKPIDVGFRVFKCADSNMKDVYYTPSNYSQQMLFDLEDNIKEDRNDLDLLFGCMLDWGVTLDLPLRSEKIDGVTIHIVNEGDLVACFDQNIPESAIDHIASLLPMRVVLRDSCFKEAKEKMNFFEIFKQRTGWSEEEVRKNVKVI